MTDFAHLLDWLEGRLEPAAAAQVAAAVERDAHLAAGVAWIQRFHGLAADVVLETPPAEVRSRLAQRFAAARPAPPSARQRVQAVLTFDSLSTRPVGVRAGLAPPGQRHVVLESEAADVAVDVYEEDVRWRVEGQLLPHGDEAPVAAELLLREPAGDVVAAASADADGGFALGAVPRAAYRLEVQWGDVVVEAELDLR